VGTTLALLSAVLFGASTPAVQRFGRGFGPFTTAALLYLGAAGFSAATLARRRIAGAASTEAPIGPRHVPRLILVAAFGAVLAPVALAWGLARASGVAASLLLNLEAVFTLVLGVVFYREHVGRRVAVAAVVMTAGGAVLLAGRGEGGRGELWGLLAVGLATLGWALDNALSRPLSDLDPAAVVAAKGGLGAFASLALAAGEPWPSAPGAAAALVLSGAIGYGASLRLYLLAQRRLGAGRTASVYAAAPFVGALVARAAGQPLVRGALPGGALMALGVYLHLTEQHEHEHEHEALEHDHAHRHDDGHHDHAHDPMPAGEHSHPHRHDPIVHDHPHAPDLHHRHGH
jgi:drug/metabolite transporter (DMT)-like permease